MKDVIQIHRKKNGRFSKRSYAFDDEKVMAALEQWIVKYVKRALAVGALIGFTVGLGIGVWL